MKKILSFFTALLFAGSMMAVDVTIVASDFTPVESLDYSTTKDGVTVSVNASTVTADQIRIFKGKTITISAEENITKIEFTCTANGAAKYGPGSFNPQEGYTYEENGKTGTWVGNSTSVSFTAETNQVRATQIVVTLGGEAPATSWTEVRFNEAIPAVDLPENAVFENGDFKVAIADSEDKMLIDENSANFGDETQRERYDFRLKTGGKSQNATKKNYIVIAVPSAGELRIAVRTGSSSDETRTLVLAQGDDTLYNAVVKDADVKQVSINDTTTLKVYPYVTVPVKAGEVNVAYPVGALNFYGFAFKAGEEPIVPVQIDTIKATCAEAAAAMPEVNGGETEDVFAVTGYITNTNGTVSKGQQTFWIDDVQGTEKTIQGYWCNLPEGEDALKLGDKIVLTGKILNYNNIPEIKNGDVTILERSTMTIDTIKASVAEALAIGAALELGAVTTDIYEITGYVTAMAGKEDDFEKYGNQTYWIADEQGSTAASNEEGAFEVYRGKADEPVAVGYKVSIATYIKNYNGLIESEANSPVIILEKTEVPPILPEDTIVATCAEAAAAMPAENGEVTEATYIVTGYITNTNGVVSKGQQVFWMDDVQGSKNTLQGYWCNLPEGENALNVGDKIVLTGKILNYNNTPEIKNGDVAILERSAVTIDTIPVSVAEALAIAAQLEAGTQTVDVYEITGYVTGMIGSEDGGWAQYGNQIFWIADEQGSTAVSNEEGALEIYQGVASEEVKVGYKVSVTSQLTNYNGLLETVRRAAVTILEKPETPPIEPADTILATCAEAAAAMPAENGEVTEATYIVTGYITNTNGTVSKGQQVFWMDDVQGSEKTLQGYWCNLPEGESALNVGDKIVLTGKILNYNNTPEIKNGDVAILERSAVTIDTIQVSVAQAVEIGLALTEGAKTTDKYIIEGYVTQIDDNSFDTQYNNMTFWIADEQGSTAASTEEGALYVYRGKPDVELQVGDKIRVETVIYNYFGIIETVQSSPVTLLERPEPIVPQTECAVSYLDIDARVIGKENIVLHLPDAPEVEDFIFIGWKIAESFVEDGIQIQAVYEYTGDQGVAPDEVSLPGNDARKLLRNGNVYILTGDKTYTITGMEVR